MKFRLGKEIRSLSIVGSLILLVGCATLDEPSSGKAASSSSSTTAGAEWPSTNSSGTAPSPSPGTEAGAGETGTAAASTGAMSIPPEPAQEKNASVYPVWYATNRRPVFENGTVTGYANISDPGKIHYGKISVDIPKDFLKNHNNQGWFDSLFRSDEATLNVRRPVPLSQENFINAIRDQFRNTTQDGKMVLIYLHGFKTSFEEAAQRAASIGYQLKIPITAFFSWPSQGKYAAYFADKDAASNSEDEIANFIIRVQKESEANTIHIIAHSMGNYALLRAMYRPVMQDAIRHGLHFGQVILAAPDVDSEFFSRNVGVFDNIAKRVTLYVSSGDMALNASKELANRPRAGFGPPILVVSGIDTLDVSSVNLTWLGHSYIESEIAVLEDIHDLIFHGDPPARRARIWRKENYWEFK